MLVVFVVCRKSKKIKRTEEAKTAEKYSINEKVQDITEQLKSCVQKLFESENEPTNLRLQQQPVAC